MNKYIKKFITRGVFTGIPVGVFIGQVVFSISLLSNGIYVFETTTNQFFMQLLTSAFIGFYCIGLSVVFSIDSWSLLKQVVVNFVCMIIIYFPIAYCIGWMPEGFMGKFYFTLNFIIVYIVVFNTFKYKIRYINKQINNQLNKINK
ncbi:MAG: DUF3021 domain-containing protein [Paraclostridium sp.]|uniref:DUF3021 domain-containing protein n=1 Tax=Paraclostridium sp. TaxID=2023273 RepID=UPI003F2A7654